MSLCVYAYVCVCVQTRGIALALPHVLAHHTDTYRVFDLCGVGIGLEQRFHHAQVCLSFCCRMQWEHATLRQQHERLWEMGGKGGREREREREQEEKTRISDKAFSLSLSLFLSLSLSVSLLLSLSLPLFCLSCSVYVIKYIHLSIYLSIHTYTFI